MRTIFALFITLLAVNTYAQPGPFGGYSISFVLTDESGEFIVDDNNFYYTIYPSFYQGDKYEETDTFSFDSKSQSFSYHFLSTPAGPAINDQFCINIEYQSKLMKIYFASKILGDTIQFKEGEFIATTAYHISNSIKAHPPTRILDNKIHNYDFEKVEKQAYYEASSLNIQKTDGLSYSMKHIKQLPNGRILIFGLVRNRVEKGNAFTKENNNNYSGSYNGTYSSINDDGLIMNTEKSDKPFFFNYEFEKLNEALKQTTTDFNLSDKRFSMLMPTGLRWKKSSAWSFAILSNLKHNQNGSYFITLNQQTNNKYIFVSHDKGKKWEKIFNLPSTSNIQIRLFGKTGVFAFNYHEIFYSKNEGKNWKKILSNKNIEIRDLTILDTETAFIFDNNTKSIAKVNLKKGTKTVLISNLIGFPAVYPQNKYKRFSLNYPIQKLFCTDSLLLFHSDRSFIVSQDQGNTWEVINNQGYQLFRDSSIYTFSNGRMAIEKIEKSYTYYYPKYYRAPNKYKLKSMLQIENKALYIMGYYNKDGVGSPHFFSPIKIHGI